uniref:Uncharacterized protein n=1 Tax=Rhizophora mucronata TaxID=61149 RepID=A0A2P2P641_RHIMU
MCSMIQSKETKYTTLSTIYVSKRPRQYSEYMCCWT